MRLSKSFVTFVDDPSNAEVPCSTLLQDFPPSGNKLTLELHHWRWPLTDDSREEPGTVWCGPGDSRFACAIRVMKEWYRTHR